VNISVNTDIRKKAKKSIDKADDTTVKMILAMLEVQEKENAFEKEIEHRFREYEEGKITPLTLDELETRVRKSHKERLKKMK